MSISSLPLRKSCTSLTSSPSFSLSPSPPQVTIRRGTLADAQTIVSYNHAMALETESKDLPLDILTKGVGRVLEDPSKGRYYVVEEDGEVAGQLMITLEWSDWRDADCWWIQSVYVRPESRRRGYFKRLYQHVREEAIKIGVCGLRLYADNENLNAQETYKNLGMTSHYSVFEDMFTHY